jgi:hypothetical protein
LRRPAEDSLRPHLEQRKKKLEFWTTGKNSRLSRSYVTCFAETSSILPKCIYCSSFGYYL